jgi:hypothetical protein
MGDAVTKYLVIPDLAQWGNSRSYQYHVVGRGKEEGDNANSFSNISEDFAISIPV